MHVARPTNGVKCSTTTVYRMFVTRSFKEKSLQNMYILFKECQIHLV